MPKGKERRIRMQGYLVSRPERVKNAKFAGRWQRKHGIPPVEINPIGTVQLSQEKYIAFCDAPLQDWGFLAPFAEQSAFRADGHADCVILEAAKQHRIAVCLEGYSYGRYVAYILESEREKNALPDSLRMATLEEILNFAEKDFQPFPAWIEMNPRYNDSQHARRYPVRPVAVERCDRLSDPDPALYTSYGNYSLWDYRKSWRLWYADGIIRPDTTTEWARFSWDMDP